MIRSLCLAALAATTALPALADVNIYSYRQPELVEPILDQFTEKTGIKTNVVFLNKGLIERLQSEGDRSPADLILTTESTVGEGGECIQGLPLRWVGAPNGSMWRQQPLRLAFCRHCIFRPLATAALDQAGIPWDMVVDSESDRTVEATISADLAVGAGREREGAIPLWPSAASRA